MDKERAHSNQFVHGLDWMIFRAYLTKRLVYGKSLAFRGRTYT
jgi:hypothetical protein